MKKIMVTVPDNTEQIDIFIWRTGGDLQYTPKPVQAEDLIGICYDEKEKRWRYQRGEDNEQIYRC